MSKLGKWDNYFLSVCFATASNSSCHSRQIGAILVRDKAIISTGYNGPPRGISHCDTNCKRLAAGFASGHGLHLCPAVHAEVNCIAQAARNGINTEGTTMYMSCGIPCKDCLGVIINAGITALICTNLEFYDELSRTMLEESDIYVRKFGQI